MMLPSNIELEQAVLGTFLRLPESIYAIQLLDSQDFSVPEHQEIFSLIRQAADEGRHMTPITLTPAIRGMKIGQITPGEYLLRLLGAFEPIEFLPGYISEIKQLTARRALMNIGAVMTKFGQSPTKSVGEFYVDVVEELDFYAAGLRAQRRSTRHFSEPVGEKIELLRTGETKDFIHTGLSDLNRIMGGWHRGELAVIAARTSMGKTAFALSTLRQAARHGTASIFFSMEISADQASCRLLSDAIWNSQTPITYERIDQHKVEKYDIERLERAATEIEDLPMIIDDARGLTVSEIGARARRARGELEKKGKRLDVLCVDHLGKIRATSRYAGNKVHETGEKTNALAQLSLDLDCAVIALQQLNRGPEGREDKRPGMTDLRDSGNIEEDADTVSFLYRPAYYLERNKHDDEEAEHRRIMMLESKQNVLEFIVSKNRRGPICNKEFFIDIANNAVRDLL